MPTAVEFVPADPDTPADSTRLGGQPAWIGEPQWPLSRQTGQPMCFVGQFRLPSTEPGGTALAYLFMTEGEEYVDGTWEPEGGENAVIVQPGGVLPDFVTVRPDAKGPSFGVESVPVPSAAETEDGPWQFLGGVGIAPNWLQGEEEPGPGWMLLAQLDSAGLPFGINFGDAGIGYVFLSPDGREGRFLWQCS